MRSRQKWAFSLIVAAAAVPLAIVSVAYACGRLATLYVGPQRVAPGAEVSGFGRNYTAAPTASTVDIHFNRRNGPVVWSGRPGPNGEIRPRFSVPDVKPGHYTLLATQTTSTGAPSPGTPGRARVFIGTAAQQRAMRSDNGAWASPVPVGGGSGGPGPLVPADVGLLAALLSGGLLAGGLALWRGDRRRQDPAAAS